MLEITENTLCEKENEMSISDNVDLSLNNFVFIYSYLEKMKESCQTISAETIKEELKHMNQKEEMKEWLDKLEAEKQLYFVFVMNHRLIDRIGLRVY